MPICYPGRQSSFGAARDRLKDGKSRSGSRSRRLAGGSNTTLARSTPGAPYFLKVYGLTACPRLFDRQPAYIHLADNPPAQRTDTAASRICCLRGLAACLPATLRRMLEL